MVEESTKISSERILAGKISAAYGIKGWVKVYSHTDPIEHILDYAPWLLKRRSTERLLKLDQGRIHGKGIVVLPEGFQDRNQAEELIGYEIWIDKQALPKLDQDDYYWHQLEGLQVINEAGECLGVISQMLETGANDVIVVSATQDSIDDQERLIPWVEPDYVREVDLANKKVLVSWAAEF